MIEFSGEIVREISNSFDAFGQRDGHGSRIRIVATKPDVGARLCDRREYAPRVQLVGMRLTENTVIKRVRPTAAPSGATDTDWLKLDDQVQVELTSEDPQWPIEGALMAPLGRGWRAATPGPQTITLVWPSPIHLHTCPSCFRGAFGTVGTQEFVLRASTREGDHDVVRQQFTFAPPRTTRECEVVRRQS